MSNKDFRLSLGISKNLSDMSLLRDNTPNMMPTNTNPSFQRSRTKLSKKYNLAAHEDSLRELITKLCHTDQGPSRLMKEGNPDKL